MPFDFHTIVDGLVIGFSAYQAYQNTVLRNEILTLKVWILENFEKKAP